MKIFISRPFLSLPILAIVLASFDFAIGQPNSSPAQKTLRSSGYAPVNGLKMYYEIHGEGKPLVLLHGAFMNIDLNYGALIPALAKSHKVIAFEMQGHGRTADVARAFSFPALADDVAGALRYLKVDSADVLGYSLGATVALELAIRHPKLVSKVIVISSVFKMEGWNKATRDAFRMLKPEFLEDSPLKTDYDRLAPDKTHWRDFVTKLVVHINTSFDLGAANIKNITAPALLIMGDNDGVDLHHVAEMYALLGGGVSGDLAGLPKSQLAILPGMTHVTLMMQTEKLTSIILPFLDKTNAPPPHH